MTMIGQQNLREGDLLARRYLLRERIGTGGMSVIWRAWDEALQRVVAVKVLDGPLGTDRGDRELIRREARAAARIDHPSVIQVYDYGETVTPRGRLAAYVVMQLLDGDSVADRITDGPLPVRDALTIAARVADVLAAAHHRGVVHRDVTPENVMLTSDGVKLLDFGIAAHVGEFDDTSALTFGTPPYVAPERLAGAEATGATDIYAFGVLLYEMLTGVTPYPETTWHEIEAVRRDRSPPPLKVPGVPQRVARLYELCLATEPRARPSAGQMAGELALALAREPAPSAGRRKPARARRFALLAMVLMVLGGAIGLGTWYLGQSRGRQPGVVDTEAAPTGAASPAVAAGTPNVLSAPVPPAEEESPTPTPSAAVRREAARTTTPSPSPPPEPVTVNSAAAAVFDEIDQGISARGVREDVGRDLKQQVATLTFNRAEYRQRVPALRQLVQIRERERSINGIFADRIDTAIVKLGVALDRDARNAG